MATAPPNPPRKQTTSLPPRRGRVKAQIFESLAGNLSSAATKAVLVMAKVKGGSSAANASASATTSASVSAATSATVSAATSPPASAYASDGYPDQA